MAHVVVPNYALINPTEVFQGVWKLTRALLATGWRYKASSDSTTKETTGSAALDKWAIGGAINYVQVGAQTGTAPTIGAPSSGSSIISSVSGFVANSVGRFVVIAGAVNAGNNGAFRILSQTGTTVTVYNPNAVAETGTASVSWKEVQGGAGASVTASGTGGATPGRAIVSGLTGMVAPVDAPLSRGSVGDHLTIVNATTGANNGTFRIVRYISATSVEIDNGSATTDANNGAIIWVESSPLAQVYSVLLTGTNGGGAWLCLQGPSTMKIPIGSNVPTGTFLRGELVTATHSGATGTVLGVMTDVGGATGFLVIQPRLNGTDAGIRGWRSGTTDTITGAASGATVTSSTAIPIEFVREMVFWKNNNALDGHLYVQCVDQNTESASRFSVIAANAGITATLAPGCSAAGGFPTPGSWTMIGTGNTAAVGTGPFKWFNTGNAFGNVGNVHLMCADCMETSLVDADGSWIGAVGTPANAAYSYGGMLWQRVDGSEDGDVDPYVGTSNMTGTAFAGTRLGPSAPVGNGYDFFAVNSVLLSISSAAATPWSGWRRRGFAATDAYQQFWGMCLSTPLNTSPIAPSTGIGRTQCATQDQFIKEPLWIVSTNTSQRMRKGYLRWLWLTEGGVVNNAYLARTWVQLGQSFTVAVAVVGPWDGQTLPVQS